MFSHRNYTQNVFLIIIEIENTLIIKLIQHMGPEWHIFYIFTSEDIDDAIPFNFLWILAQTVTKCLKRKRKLHSSLKL